MAVELTSTAFMMAGGVFLGFVAKQDQIFLRRIVCDISCLSLGPIQLTTKPPKVKPLGRGSKDRQVLSWQKRGRQVPVEGGESFRSNVNSFAIQRVQMEV